MQNVNGYDGSKGESLVRRFRRGRISSCEACRRKKKRCDQKQPCSLCVRSKSQCRYYSEERPRHQPDQRQHRQQHRPWQSDHHVVHAREHQFHSTPGPLMEHRMMPFKRCRLRASPATGLVGMRENAFLSDFFGCVGFLPLVDESEIRQAMVKIMVPVAPRQEPGHLCIRGRLDTIISWGTFDNASGINQLPQDPSFATFWSAVALGALVKGCPFEAVERYSQLAGEALAACRSDCTNAELAKALAIMTCVTSLTGNMEKFREYLELSEYYLQACNEYGSTGTHPGLPDLLLHFRKVANVQNGPMDSSWVQKEGPPQLDNMTTGDDLYRFVARSFREFDQAVCAKASESCASDLERFYYWGPSHRNSYPNDPLPGEVSEAIAAVVETTNSLEFEPLQETADRPSIRAGIGDLLINGSLIFANAARGDLPATLKNLDRSVEVYERYPGLCRCLMASHTSHTLLTTLAAMDDSRSREMYGRLREAYNSCRASHTPPIPPFDEWQGMAAICGDLHCRVIETLIKSEHMKALTPVPVNYIDDSAGLTQTTIDPQGETAMEVSPGSAAHGEVADPVQAPLGGSWTGSNAKSKGAEDHHHAIAISCAGNATASLASQSHPSSQWETGADNTCVVDDVATTVLSTLARSARVGGHSEHTAEVEDDEVAAADLLDVIHAMWDALHAS